MEELAELARRTEYNASRLARELHLAPRTLTRRFRETLSCAPGEWLAAQRMRDAVLLLDRRYTIKEVAVALAYRQAPQFCREFRRRFRCTPSEYVAQWLASSQVIPETFVSWPVAQTANLLSQTANSRCLQAAQVA